MGRKCSIKLSIGSFLLQFMLFTAYGQDLPLRRFEEQFPNRPVSDFIVDQKGFLWIGTFGAGIYRFDGFNYHPYTLNWKDSTSLDSNFIFAMAEDQRGRIWVGTDNGLCRYEPDTDRFQRINVSYFDQPKQDFFAILSIYEDKKGNLFFGSNGKGLIFLDSAATDRDTIDATPYYQNFNVNHLAADERGNIFAATDQGLMVCSPGQRRLEQPKIEVPSGLLKVPMESILYNTHTLWVGTISKGLIEIVNYNSPTPEIKHHTFTNKRIMALSLFDNDQLICATENDGIVVWNIKTGKSKQFLNNPYDSRSIETNSVWSLEVDEMNRLWVGYYNKGIGLYDPEYNKFGHILQEVNNPNSLQSNSVNSLVEAGDSVIFIGMDGGGVDKYYPNQQRIEHLTAANGYKGLDNLSVQSIYLDSQNNLWVGTWNGGIYLLPNGKRTFLNFNVSNTGLQSNRILDFCESADGRIWIATFGSGLHQYDPSQKNIKQVLSQEILQHGLYYRDVRGLHIDHGGTLWIGSTSGLYTLKIHQGDTMVTSFRESYEATHLHPNFNHVLALYGDRNGRIWFGTDGAGLFSYDPLQDTLVSYNQSIGYPLNTVCAIIQDQQNNIWATGKSGLVKLNLTQNKTIHYTKQDGLTTNDFNYNAILATSQNMLYFGSVEGVNKVKAHEINAIETPLKAHLDKLKIFNETAKPNGPTAILSKAFAATNQIVLDAAQSVFTIEFTAINYTNPDQLQFAYYLEGLESDWNYRIGQRSATYTSLKDGDYVFKLKAANNNGTWTDHVTQLKIKVLPVWYKSKWALTGYIVLFLICLYLLSVFLKLRLRDRQEVLNERERHRQGEALTQRKLQFFTNISHEFRTPLTLILNPLDELANTQNLSVAGKRYLNTVQRNARRLERLIDELMDFRKLNSQKLKIHVHQINLLSFTKEIAKYFSEEAVNKEVTLEVYGDVEAYWAWVDSGLVEKILFNLLSNAFKVTDEGGIIAISLAEVTENLPLVGHNTVEAVRLSVSDTGPGLSPGHIDKVFERFYQVESMDQSYFGGTGIGLEVVKSFVALHKGKIEVESKIGEGTTFHLYFPLGKGHFDDKDIVVGEYPGKKEFLKTNTAITDTDQKEDEGYNHANKSTVLVVDDNPELRKYIKSEFQEYYRIETAKNGEEGLSIAQKLFPDVIITDVMMPGMDGFEFCEKIKSNLKTSHIPVIMLTAKSAPEDHITGVDKGADVYLTKPFDMRLLRTQLKQMLKRQQTLYNKYLKGIGELDSMQNTNTVDRDFMQVIIAYIQQNIHDSQLSVEALAEEVSLSRSQLYRKVKALVGLNVNELIRRMRLEHAKKLLQQGVANINEVSDLVGFSSPSYFTKCYKEYFGVLPTQDRKSG